ncbi:O-antigen ligase family protein [Microvirga sp. BT688]|uniref:O-antigen ligase family protein n=1 Tax=Microvirga sp. TaxID=1873136 RepID=UPI001682468D|nr:O-antigen ligase family protein [Microvirga sp.]MBD2746940.1 O-antigen ligase family protein [Microvirga sp.]
MSVREVIQLGPPLTPALSKLMAFWCVFVIAQCLGALTALLINDKHDPRWVRHDMMAYSFMIFTSCLLVVEPGAVARLQRVAWLVVAIGNLSLLLMLADGYGVIDITSIDGWWWDRFRGWTAIPNTLALLCLVLTLVSVHLAETSRRMSTRILAVLCMILPAIVGRLTKSDAFFVALIGGSLIFSVLKVFRWLQVWDQRMMIRTCFAWTLVMLLPVTLALSVPIATSFLGQGQGMLNGIFRKSDEGLKEDASLRMYLWSQAVKRGLQSGMLGLGPGPHLVVPPVIAATFGTENEPGGVENPDPSVAPNFEAHNTFLDLFTQGGLLMVLNFLCLCALTVISTLRAHRAGLATLICCLLAFGMFHFIVRQPIFWFAIALSLVSATSQINMLRKRGRTR